MERSRSVARLSRNMPGEISRDHLRAAPVNSGCIAPQPGFLEFLRDITQQHGALLIFDEVITGFRLGLVGRRASTASRPIWRPMRRPSAPARRSASWPAGPIYGTNRFGPGGARRRPGAGIPFRWQRHAPRWIHSRAITVPYIATCGSTGNLSHGSRSHPARRRASGGHVRRRTRLPPLLRLEEAAQLSRGAGREFGAVFRFRDSIARRGRAGSAGRALVCFDRAVGGRHPADAARRRGGQRHDRA